MADTCNRLFYFEFLYVSCVVLLIGCNTLQLVRGYAARAKNALWSDSVPEAVQFRWLSGKKVSLAIGAASVNWRAF